jgi:hypothetical protein
VGLFLGPAAMVLGVRARRRGLKEPGFTADSPARAAFLLGGLITLTNWIGLVLMIMGLFG